MLKRKLAIGKASTIALNTSDVSGHPGREDRFGAGSSVAAINLRQLKRNLRLRISNYFPVDLLLPDTDWTEPLEGVLKSLGKSVWSEETIERAVTRVQGRAWKKPRLDLDDIQVVLKRICLFHGPDTSGYEASSEKQGQGGHESEKWERRLREVRAKCNKLEQELLEGVIKPSDLQLNFGDVIIDENVKETIKFLTSMFQFRAETTSHFLLSQIQIKGALLYGPPGTGKTHFSRAIAKESGATMLAIDGAQVTSQWVGQTEKYIKAAFTLASKLAPCVLFIDEADSLFRRRTRDDRSWERSSVTQFLSMMDGLKHSAKVDAPFVLVATNRPMDLDEAFLRRLPQKAMIGLPTHSSRSKILRLFLKEDDLDPETVIDRLVDLTDGYSGSDLRSLCAEAALIWAIDQQRNAEKESTMTPVKVLLNNAHFDRALENIRPTVSKQSLKELEEFDRRFTSKPGKVSSAPKGGPIIPTLEYESN
ncbi:hypothetical protein N8I77_009659 [Diaporthe amygdali]|uniref:AAA+ ATPase domain-containing protein n=1 Tax=Phomopsis amygdali TaxID=1214568 RepID=A0AAD9SBI9_PHOAM|nr:hypothetical protein N8I77_009659 [Diaporthe amygdali]